MHGMMSPETDSPEPHLAPVTAEAGWGRFGGQGLGRPTQGLRRLRRNTRVQPLSPALLAAAAVLLDAVSIAGAGIGLAALDVAEGRPAWTVIILLAALCPALATVGGAYGHAALLSGGRAALVALGAAGAGLAGVATVAAALGAGTAFPPGLAGLWFLLAAAPMLAVRLGGSRLLRAMPERTRQRAVLVGDGRQAARFAAAAGSRPDSSLRLLGLVDDGQAPTDDAARGRSGLPQLGSLDTLCAMIRRGEVDQVVVTLPWNAEARIRHVEAVLADYPVNVRLAPDLIGHRGLPLTAPVAGRLRLLHLADRPMSGLAGLVKRLEDYTLAIVGLAIVAVPMALIALAIRLDSPGPILFRQRRAGFNNRDFHVLKFRTMHHADTDHEARRQVTAGDPRVTQVGAILRRTSLDELPQLFNVLRGEMSFIGPRPHAPGTRAGGRLFEQVVARYAARHRVNPGLTGLAQVRGWRGPTETEEKLIRRVESDLEYIDTWSPWLDLKIIFRTLLAVARMRNAL